MGSCVRPTVTMTLATTLLTAAITAAEHTDVYFSIALQDQAARIAEWTEEERRTAAEANRTPKRVSLESIRGSVPGGMGIRGVGEEVVGVDPVHSAQALPPIRDDALCVVHE